MAFRTTVKRFFFLSFISTVSLFALCFFCLDLYLEDQLAGFYFGTAIVSEFFGFKSYTGAGFLMFPDGNQITFGIFIIISICLIASSLITVIFKQKIAHK